jgi:hypothetical protein
LGGSSAAAGGYHAPAIIFITLLHSPCLQSTDIFPNSGMTRSASSPTLSPHHADFEAGGKKKTKKKDKAAGDLQLYDLYHLMLSYFALSPSLRSFSSFFVLRLSPFFSSSCPRVYRVRWCVR